MGTNRNNPFLNLINLHDRLTRSMENRGTAMDMSDTQSGSWSPVVDVFETDVSLVIVAELPGLDKADVNVTVEGDRLIIRGERTRHMSVPGEQTHRMERAHGTFHRTFPLPSSVDTDQITANQENGILTITLPLDPSREPRRIPILRGN